MPWSIILGELVAGIGAAILAGSGLSLLRYWRTGRFPGQEEGQRASPGWAWAWLAAGLVLTVWGLATLDAAGFF